MPRKLIIIDNQRDWLKRSSDLLSDHGYEVKIATNLEEGLKFMHQQAPHLVLINSSQIGNLSQLRRIVESCSLPDCRIVVMVPGKLEIPKLSKMFKAGADDCITKPYDSQTLKAMVEKELVAKRRGKSSRGSRKIPYGV
jgi:DNA-binding NtrC family response regulator